MRIALVTPFELAPNSGVTQHVLGLRTALDSFGHDVTVIAPGTSRVPDEDGGIHSIARPIRIQTNGATAALGLDPRAWRRLGAILDRHRSTLVHLHEPFTPLLPWFGFAAARRRRIAVVGTFHAYRPALPAWALPFLPFVRHIGGGLDARIAVSEPAREYAARYHPGPYEIIPNGIDILRFSASSMPSFQARRPERIGFIGRFDDPRKGVSVLIDAMHEIRRSRPGAELVVVGAGGSGRQAVAPGVTYTGFVPDTELAHHLSRFDVLCAPSLGGESFGVVLAEAMAMGVPVVASDIPGYASVLTDGQEGLLVPPGDSGALAHAVLSLLADPARRRRLGEAGRATARLLAWDAVTPRILDMYERVLLSNRDRVPPYGLCPKTATDGQERSMRG